MGESCLYPGKQKKKKKKKENKWRVQCRMVDVSFKSFSEWGLLHSQTEWQLLPMYSTKSYTLKYIIGQGRQAPVKPSSFRRAYTTLPLLAAPAHSTAMRLVKCLYWKISCLSTWQTPSSLSERELKINSLMASQSARTSMRHKQAHASPRACYTGSHFKCV